MAISRTKVAVVGAGKVGAALAYRLTTGCLCDDLVLVDIDQRKAWAEAADLQHALGFSGRRMNVSAGSYYDCADADICAICVGAGLKPDATRLERIDRAATLLGRIVPSVMASEFHGIFLVVTSPVDLMTWLVQQLSGLPASRVIGTGTALDTARLRYYLADALDVAPGSVNAAVLGEHGEDQFIPWSQVSAGGKPIDEILADSPDRLPDFDKDAVLNTIADITYQAAAVKGTTTWAIASVSAEIIGAILRDESRVLPVSAMPDGAYGLHEVYLGVPAVLAGHGVREVVEYHLREDELARLHRSADALRDYMVSIS